MYVAGQLLIIETNLCRGAAVVNRIPSRNDLHYEDPKTVHIALLIQHPSLCILGSHISVEAEIGWSWTDR